MWWLFDFIGILKHRPLRNLLGYLEKAFPSIYMPTRYQLKNLADTEAGWDEKGVVDRSLGKF